MESINWYYIKQGKQSGPVQFDEIKRLADTGALAGTDYVWNESMNETWAHAADVKELSYSFAPPVSPLDVAPGGKGKLKLAAKPEAVAAAVQTETVEQAAPAPVPQGWWGYYCPHCGTKVSRTHSESAQKWAGLAGAMFSMAFGSFYCPNCGEIPRRDFPAKTQMRMAGGSIALIISAIALFFLCVWLNNKYGND